MNDVIRNGVIMAVYLFIIFMIYIIISSPFDDMLTSFENVNLTESDTQVEAGADTGRIVFNMIFAAAAIIPVLYFIIWVFSREPDWRYRQ